MLCRTHKNHPSVPFCFAKFFKYLWLWGNASSEICHFNNTSGFQMLGIRMQLLQEPKVLVFLRTAARHLQCPCVLKPQQRAGTGATRESKAAVHAHTKQAGRASGTLQSKAPMRLKQCQSSCCGGFPLTSRSACDKHQCPLLYAKGQHAA